jgi:hypothetical protein
MLLLDNMRSNLGKLLFHSNFSLLTKFNPRYISYMCVIKFYLGSDFERRF